MANYEDDDIDEVENNEPEVVEEEPVAATGNRNFLLALGVLGGIFVLLIIGLVILFLSRQGAGSEAANIALTNEAINAANAQTAAAATLSAIQLLTPSVTPVPSNTAVPPTATRTRVVAATATNTLSSAEAAGLFTATPSATLAGGGTGAGTATATAASTLAAGLTQTRAAGLTATATLLPSTGFAEDIGLPGMFGMAIGLVLLIVLARRLRLSTTS